MPKDTFFNLNAEKQEKVMRASVSEFIKHGFEKGNIGDIAKNAGVAKGSMYQYFDNKKELFLYTVRWSLDLVFEKYGKHVAAKDKAENIFDFLYHTSRDLRSQLKNERELVIFIQDVFLGKYRGLTDESMDYMMKVGDDYVLKLIQDGKSNGSIRTDIDDNILQLFISGASIKIKEYLMNRARAMGEDIVDEAFEDTEKELKAFIELLKNGMGAK